MTEREFIAKIHKALDNNIYKWKIHDAYHGGVPDAYYSGPAGCMFIEYKYHRKMPVRTTSKIATKTSSQQKLWLQRAIDHNVLAYLVIGVEDLILMTQDVQREFFTVEEFKDNACTFDEFIDKLTKICLK